MPRGPRLDVAGALYHVIARGVERRAVFRDDRDRLDFLRRVAALSGDMDITVFAFALLDNHFHLVLRRGQRRLGGFMHRLLTGYSGRFNRRHGRVGHLFQNRYTAVLCDAEAYLLELVRYVHLNPVRARIVSDPLGYSWTSHHAYLLAHPPAWLDTALVLGVMGSRRAYRRFIADGIGQPRRAELTGAAPAVSDPSADAEQLWLGGQVLGTATFARRFVRARPRRVVEPKPQRRAADVLPALAARVARRFGIAPARLASRGRAHVISRARRALIRAAVLRRGIRPVEVSRYLRISTAAVARHLRVLEREKLDC